MPTKIKGTENGIIHARLMYLRKFVNEENLFLKKCWDYFFKNLPWNYPMYLCVFHPSSTLRYFISFFCDFQTDSALALPRLQPSSFKPFTYLTPSFISATMALVLDGTGMCCLRFIIRCALYCPVLVYQMSARTQHSAETTDRGSHGKAAQS